MPQHAGVEAAGGGRARHTAALRGAGLPSAPEGRPAGVIRPKRGWTALLSFRGSCPGPAGTCLGTAGPSLSREPVPSSGQHDGDPGPLGRFCPQHAPSPDSLFPLAQDGPQHVRDHTTPRKPLSPAAEPWAQSGPPLVSRPPTLSMGKTWSEFSALTIPASRGPRPPLAVSRVVRHSAPAGPHLDRKAWCCWMVSSS